MKKDIITEEESKEIIKEIIEEVGFEMNDYIEDLKEAEIIEQKSKP